MHLFFFKRMSHRAFKKIGPRFKKPDSRPLTKTEPTIQTNSPKAVKNTRPVIKHKTMDTGTVNVIMERPLKL